jgi:enoyl-CoA hydratase/carnithine racemase
VGTSAALMAVITGERFPAADALARGFVDEVVPRQQLRARTDALAARLAARPPAAVRAAKAAVWAALDLPLPVGLAREADLAAGLRAAH